MKKNKLPANRLDIIVPVLSRELDLNRFAEAYPELLEMRQSMQDSKHTTTLYAITKHTPRMAREATAILASYFRREFGYDFPPYSAVEHGHEKDRIFLLAQPKDWETEYAVGAIAFRWRTYADAPAQLVLSWVWLHPFLRRQGILTAYWPLFRTAYGPFEVEPPLSKAMRAFLEKMA